jgi:DNA polymerase (family 10)
MERILEKAAETGVVMEFNANPHRLDLDWRLMPLAKKLGVKISINPDAHTTDGLADVFYGLPTARKGWIEPTDVLNTMPLDQIESWLLERKKHK